MDVERLKKLFESSTDKYGDAERMGVTYEALRRIMSGGDLKVSTLEKIARYYEKPVSYFFDEVTVDKKRERQGAKQLEIERLKGQIKGMQDAIDRLGLSLKGLIVDDN